MNHKEVEGDLVKLALRGDFDVIAHGVNCFCRQKKGIALQMVKYFHTDDFSLEDINHYGNINKLGQIDIEQFEVDDDKRVHIVNCYTQFKIKKFNDQDYEYTTTEDPLDYDALTLCLKKINHVFKGKHIGLPRIGTGLAGGHWPTVKNLIETHLKDCDVTIVNYKPEK